MPVDIPALRTYAENRLTSDDPRDAQLLDALDELEDACLDLAAYSAGCAVCPKLGELDAARARIAELEAELASACRDLAVYSESCARKDARIRELAALADQRAQEQRLRMYPDEY
jgi:hypothetical protein